MPFSLFKKKPQSLPEPPPPPHAECRGLWLALPDAPDWVQESPDFLVEGESGPQGSISKQLFEAAFSQSWAIAWLPLLLDAATPAAEVEEAWRQATADSDAVTNALPPPPTPDIRAPGTGSLVDRAIALFEQEPALPAVLVLGAEGPAAALALLARPGLALPPGSSADDYERPEPTVMTPFWDRAPIPGTALWGNIPPALVPSFLRASPPIGALYQTATAQQEGVRPRERTKHARDTLLRAFANAGLSMDAVNPPDIGWVAHSLGTRERFIALATALTDCGCDVAPFEEGGSLEKDPSEPGQAGSTLLLAAALARAVQLGRPVLAVVAGQNNGMEAAIVIPTKTPILDTPSS
jgi:hypothetical protein